MAIVAGQNNFSYTISDGQLVYAPDLSGVKPILQGQIAVWDATLNGAKGGIRPALTQADMAKYCGIANQNSVLTSLKEQLPSVIVGFQNVYYLPTTAADVYTHGAPVYYNEVIADSMTVTMATNAGARTVAVGYVILPNEQLLAGILSITGAAGTAIQVAIAGNFPGNGY